MGQGTIKAAGAYLPMLRLQRTAAADALKWSGLPGPRKGRRAVAGWDEDSLTLGVEAARLAVGDSPPNVLTFASTSAYFTERAMAPLVVEALGLPAAIRTADVANSRRAGVSALLAALTSREETLVVAGEKRHAEPGSAAHLAFGDGGAAIRVGCGGGARLIGAASHSHDFVDIFASRDHPGPYPSEERFVRDVAVAEILAPAIADACANAGVAPGNITLAAVQEPVPGCYAALSRKLGLKAENLASKVSDAAGDLGAAHPLFALALALESAVAGDTILLAGFGSGCDALLLAVDAPLRGASTASQALAHGASLHNYVRFLSLTGGIGLDWGVRAEFEQKAQPSVIERHGRDMTGFIGGRDADGNVQFPKSRIPVAGGPPAPLADVRLAEEPATIVSITADRLNFTPDPPFRFGLVQFANGARVLMEFTDVEGQEPMVGDALRMRFRIKAIERRRGFRTYFWKAAPQDRPALGD